MLYNQTTDIKGALEHGVPFQHISFAPDWGPSGSPSMMFEAKVVAEYNSAKLDNLLTPKQILSMMTVNPAIIAGYENYIGQLKEGLRADITIIKKNDDDPYKSVLKAKAEDVQLTMVDGQPLFGTLEYYKKFDKGNDYEIFKINDIEKAIDITEDGIEKGNQTFKELMKILTDSMEDIRKTIPFEYEDDVKDYCKLSPLYWPKPTSYKNLMYVSVMGKGSNYADKNFQKSDVYKNRNKQAKDEFKEFKDNAKASRKATRLKGSRSDDEDFGESDDDDQQSKSKKSKRGKSKKKSKNDEDW